MKRQERGIFIKLFTLQIYVTLCAPILSNYNALKRRKIYININVAITENFRLPLNIKTHFSLSETLAILNSKIVNITKKFLANKTEKEQMTLLHYVPM